MYSKRPNHPVNASEASFTPILMRNRHSRRLNNRQAALVTVLARIQNPRFRRSVSEFADGLLSSKVLDHLLRLRTCFAGLDLCLCWLDLSNRFQVEAGFFNIYSILVDFSLIWDPSDGPERILSRSLAAAHCISSRGPSFADEFGSYVDEEPSKRC